jgi:hypothetical protein
LIDLEPYVLIQKEYGATSQMFTDSLNMRSNLHEFHKHLFQKEVPVNPRCPMDDFEK